MERQPRIMAAGHVDAWRPDPVLAGLGVLVPGSSDTHSVLDTARLFDHVFTVDANRIDDYRRDLGHNRIGLLPFAAQPRVHNPVLRGHGRKHDVAFAGTYFVNKHPE